MNRREATQTALATAVAGVLGPATALGEPDRNAPLQTLTADVCVIGGGSGGIGAALAAARNGAEVVLIEQESILGGTSTNAWVHTWEPVSGADGVPRDIYTQMRTDPLAVSEFDYDRGAPRRGGSSLPFEPRALDFTARSMLEATHRCRVLLGTTYDGLQIVSDRIAAVRARFAGQRCTVAAHVYIDCTADGNVCADAGSPYDVGEDPRSRYGEPSAPKTAGPHLNGLSLCYRITDTGVSQRPYLPQSIEAGICPRPVHIVVLPNGDHLLNPVDMINGNALLVDDYSRLMHEGHRRVLDHFYWLQQLKPDDGSRWTRFVRGTGYGTWSIVGIAPRIGVRESRRITADYILTEHDCRAGVKGQKHTDIIAISDHAVDVHGAKSKLYEVPNGPYGIPYRCLLPRGPQNLMIACRAAGFSHIAASSCRLSRTMMTLGQAAGTAAACAARHRIAPRQVDIKWLQMELNKQGVDTTA